MALVHALTRAPDTIDDAFVDDLLATGLSIAEVEAAATVAFRYAVINRAADVFAFPVPSPEDSAKHAHILSRMNHRIRVVAPEPLFCVGPDGLWRPTDLDAARTQLLDAPGATPSSLRRDVEAFAASWFGGTRPDVTLQPEVASFVGRVTAFPASMDAAGVLAMREAGFDDEGIFEITLAASVGVGCAAQERLAAVLGPRRIDG